MEKYISPAILKETPIEIEGILSSSVAESFTVETTGQEVVNYDFNEETFNHEWW